MAVAGRDCTIIAKSGHHANVTPFSSDLPVMEKVEIGDVAAAYDNPYLLETYLLVMDSINGSQFTSTVSGPGGFALPGRNPKIPVN